MIDFRVTAITGFEHSLIIIDDFWVSVKYNKLKWYVIIVDTCIKCLTICYIERQHVCRILLVLLATIYSLLRKGEKVKEIDSKDHL